MSSSEIQESLLMLFEEEDKSTKPSEDELQGVMTSWRAEGKEVFGKLASADGSSRVPENSAGGGFLTGHSPLDGEVATQCRDSSLRGS